MRCPFCHNHDTDVLDTRRLNDGDTIRRRRKCRACGRRFTTYERVESVSYDSRRAFPMLVLEACYRRPVSAASMENLVNEVETALMAREDQEVPSSVIGDLVMTHLRDLDEVAYIRFASVYRSFSDLGKLREAVEELLVPGEETSSFADQ